MPNERYQISDMTFLKEKTLKMNHFHIFNSDTIMCVRFCNSCFSFFSPCSLIHIKYSRYEYVYNFSNFSTLAGEGIMRKRAREHECLSSYPLCVVHTNPIFYRVKCIINKPHSFNPFPFRKQT